jgi:hypothetical protein
MPTLNPLCTTRRGNDIRNHPTSSQKQQHALSSSSGPIESATPSLALQVLPKPKGLFEKFAVKMREAALDMREEYLDVLDCIRRAAQSALLSWLLEPRSSALEFVDYHENVLLKEYNSKTDRIYSRRQKSLDASTRRCDACDESSTMFEQTQAAAFRDAKKWKRLEGELVHRCSAKFDQMRDERQRILQISSDQETQALRKVTNKVIRGVKYHLQRLPAKFQKRLLSVEHGLSREENRINAFLEESQSKLALLLHGGTKWVCKQKGCFEVFDPTLVPSEKQCSFPKCSSGLSPAPAHCGCAVMQCKRAGGHFVVNTWYLMKTRVPRRFSIGVGGRMVSLACGISNAVLSWTRL